MAGTYLWPSAAHGALAVEAYRDMGYLPEAMRNYLLRLGWSHGDDEIISTEQAIEWFSTDSIGRSAARMDYKKLDNLNGHYIRAMDNYALADQVAAILLRQDPPVSLDAKAKARLVAAMPGLKERAKTLVELAQAAEFLYTDGQRDLDAAAEKLLKADSRQTLAGLQLALSSVQKWSAPDLEETARGFAESNGLKLGQVAQPMRAALTGKANSPPIFDVLAVLGREESLARLGAYAG